MMKNVFILLLICLYSWSCEQIKIPNSNNTSKTKPYEYEYGDECFNGYKRSERIRACIPDYEPVKRFYKLLFYTKTHGIIATKYAYPVSIINNDRYKSIYMRHLDSKYFINNIKINLDDEFDDFFIGARDVPVSVGYAKAITFQEHASILYLKKKEYETFIRNNPVTIMDEMDWSTYSEPEPFVKN